MIKSELNPECGKRLKECLEDRSMTQKQLADLTGFTPQYINNILSGRKPMTVKAANQFAKHLNVKEDYLLCVSEYKSHIDEIVGCSIVKNDARDLLLKFLDIHGIKVLRCTIKTNTGLVLDNPAHLLPPYLCDQKELEGTVLRDKNGDVIAESFCMLDGWHMIGWVFATEKDNLHQIIDIEYEILIDKERVVIDHYKMLECIDFISDSFSLLKTKLKRKYEPSYDLR